MRSTITARPLVFFLLLTACANNAASPRPPGSGGTGGEDETGGSGVATGGSAATGGKGPATGTGGTGGALEGTGGATPDAGSTAPEVAPPPDSAPPTSGPRPSAGCGKMNPPTGARTIMTGGKTGNFMVAIPAGYDPMKPYPLGFAFHGYNLNEKTCYQGSECPGFRTVVGAKAITVFPKSIGPGWEYPVNLLAPNVQFVKDIIAQMKTEYCIDESRVFVSGVSSGGQMTHHLSCQLGEELWAAAPIAGYLEMASRTDCKGSPAQVVIHGVKDGLQKAQAARDLAAMRNGCPTPPDNKALEDRINAAFAAKQKTFGCVDYVGCAKNPVRYCLHSEPLYAGNTHGWPDTGGQMVDEFLGTLK